MNPPLSLLRVCIIGFAAIHFAAVCSAAGLNLAPKRGTSNQGAFLPGVFGYHYSDQEIERIRGAHFTRFRYPVNVETCFDSAALDRLAALTDRLGNRGIVCMWDTNEAGEVDHGNGRINDIDKFTEAWKSLYQRFKDRDGLRFEIFNEPFGYESAETYIATMRSVIHDAGIPMDRCIIDGIGYAEDIRSVVDAGWEGAVAYHFYPNWLPDGQRTAENYSKLLLDALEGIENEIVITEFGADLSSFDPGRQMRRRQRRPEEQPDKDIAALAGIEDALAKAIARDQRITETYHWHGWDNHDSYSFWNERNALGAERIKAIQSLTSKVSSDQRPNIIWIMAEDISTELSCYGHPAVQTPNADRLAAQGVRYTHAFCTAPSCTPSRNAMITGVYQTRTSTQNQRTKIDRLPDGIQPITHLLREAGYYTALACGYSGKTDVMFPAPKLFDGNDWSKREKGQPFFAQITLYHSHRQPKGVWEKIRTLSKHPVDPDAVELPPYFPDHPDCRKDWALYLDSIQRNDLQLGQILDRLRNEGIEDNTIVIFMGDNGRCHLRGKCWCYDPGLLVPLIIRDPRPDSEKPGKAGTVIDDLVSTLDISATVLDLAGAEMPDYLDGKTLWSANPHTRSHIFAARDLIDEVLDPIRCVRTQQYKYIRNYEPENGYRECDYVRAHRPMLPVIERLDAEGRLTQTQQLILKTRKPTEELYDIEADPHEIHNLAESPDHQKTLIELRALLVGWIQTTQDKGLTPQQRSQPIP
ncbi:sulfatase-like hydrolase/transferase [Aporhodopirellula aestuarii]|uniref:Sulfatase-like hydrolase/transferase n=1 Tax=Aporhodopirellula aestuarii TaxID=2950107 RepID=A0ABT0U740_9BACT|nr:sulfatase-like hydrolase/transferase [Aporhodopirellula aestuarii]MCM2372606.1 sulfatase-like hydrolase/transferase [Aporhodopirellula aestuarii]